MSKLSYRDFLKLLRGDHTNLDSFFEIDRHDLPEKEIITEFLDEQEHWVKKLGKDWFMMDLDIISGDWEEWPEDFWPEFNRENFPMDDLTLLASIQLGACQWNAAEHHDRLKETLLFSWESEDTVWRNCPRAMRTLLQLTNTLAAIKTDWEGWTDSTDDSRFVAMNSLLLGMGEIDVEQSRVEN